MDETIEIVYKNEASDYRRGMKLLKYEDCFFQAIRNNRLDIAQYFFDIGAPDYNVAVSIACENGNAEIIKFLIKNDCKINTDYRSSYPLPLFYRDANGKPIDFKIFYPITMATKNGYLEIVKLLVEQGSKVDKLTIKYAVDNNRYDIVQYLISKQVTIFDI